MGDQQGEETPYERLLEDAMAGDGALFTGEDAVEASWTVVESVLQTHDRCHLYQSGSWGPNESNLLIARDGHRWQQPSIDPEKVCP